MSIVDLPDYGREMLNFLMPRFLRSTLRFLASLLCLERQCELTHVVAAKLAIASQRPTGIARQR